MRLVTPTIASLSPYRHGKTGKELEKELGISNFARLDANENALGPSSRAVEAARNALGELNRYPDQSALELREKLARVHGVSPDEIVQGNGSNELIELVVRTFATPSDHIVFAEPAFVVYRLISLSHGVPFTAVPLARFTHDLDAMADAVTDKTRVIFITNPNNPTGTHVTRDAVRKLFSRIPPEVIVAFDEAYLDYADAEDVADAIALRKEHARVIAIRTFSKIHGLASLRVGYAIGPLELVEYMHRVRPPFNVGIVGQAAAVAALEDQEHMRKSRELVLRERKRVSHALSELGCDVVPSQANFVFVDMKRPAAELHDALLRRGVIVRQGPGTFLRITIGTEPENTRFLTAVAEIFATGKRSDA